MKEIKEPYTEVATTGNRDELPPLPSRFQPGDLAVFRTHSLDEGVVVEIKGVLFLRCLVYYDLLIGTQHVEGGLNVGDALIREFDYRLDKVPPEMLYGMHTKGHKPVTLRRVQDGEKAVGVAQSTPFGQLENLSTEQLENMYNTVLPNLQKSIRRGKLNVGFSLQRSLLQTRRFGVLQDLHEHSPSNWRIDPGLVIA